MTVFTQNQTALRMNGRPSFMITDILAASNSNNNQHHISREPSQSPPAIHSRGPITNGSGVIGELPDRHPHHLHQIPEHLRGSIGHLMAGAAGVAGHPLHQHLHQQHHHHLSLMNAAKMMGVTGGHHHGVGGAAPSMLGMMGGLAEMRVPAAGLSPTAGDDFDSDENEEGDDADGDSSVCSNGTKDDDAPGNGNNPLSGMRPSSKKQRKARTAFSDHQLHSLEKSFTRQKYLSVQDRMELANKLGISDTQVKTWFQNRRTKWKRQTSVGFELLVEAGNYAAYQRAYRNYPQMDGVPGGPGGWPGYPGSAAPSPAELYYRQASLAALQGHNPYGMYAAAAALNNLPKPTTAPGGGFPMFAAPPSAPTTGATSPLGQNYAYPPGLARPTAQRQMPPTDRRSVSPVDPSHDQPRSETSPHHEPTNSRSPVPPPPRAEPANNADDESDSDIEV